MSTSVWQPYADGPKDAAGLSYQQEVTMQLTWTRSVITSDYTMSPGELVVYTSEQAPGYRIEHWEPGLWAVTILGPEPDDAPYLAFTRTSKKRAELGVFEEVTNVPTDQRKRY